MMIYLKLLLTAIFWGGTFVAGRFVAQNVGPYSISFLRFTIASVFLLLLTWRIEGKLPRLKKLQIMPVILLGITGIFIYNVMFLKGLKIIEAGRASLIVATCPIFITSARQFSSKRKSIS
jgi:drug/metabolite transporter (DMT)-like permease